MTPKAVTHRISKIRGLPASAAGGVENGSASPEKEVKKAKRAAATMIPKEKGAKKRGYKDEDEDDGAGGGSPKLVKKAKVED